MKLKRVLFDGVFHVALEQPEAHPDCVRQVTDALLNLGKFLLIQALDMSVEFSEVVLQRPMLLALLFHLPHHTHLFR